MYCQSGNQCLEPEVLRICKECIDNSLTIPEVIILGLILFIIGFWMGRMLLK